MRQKLTAFVNRYLVSLPSGETVAFVEQKRFAFREQVTFYSDESRREPLFGFKARSIIDLGTTYDVTSADGTLLGRFRKDFARSLLRSKVPRLDNDRHMAPDMEQATALVASDALANAVGGDVLPLVAEEAVQ